MEGIFSILESFGISVPDENKQDIQKKINSEYKTIAEYRKLKDKIDDLNSKNQDMESKLTSFDELKSKTEDLEKRLDDSKLKECKFETLKSGVDQKFVDFVTSEVNKLVSDTKDYTQALSEYNKSNPQFLVQKDNPMIVATTPNIGRKQESPASSNNDMINNFIRGKI